jgi:hypothetical protein
MFSTPFLGRFFNNAGGGGGGNGNAVNFIFHLQISGYLADTFRADGKLSTTHIRKLFTCGQVISEL